MKIFKKILKWLGIIILVGILLFAGLWIYYSTKLDVSKITEVTQTVEILDKDDAFVTGVFAKENRSKIDIDDLPSHVTKAFISIEDERFYKHFGIDVKRIFGAAFTNIKSGGKQEGASTITQQLIKLSHLSSEKTFTRKIQEAFLALELERRYSKDEILEMYLNYCYFGNGAYGIEMAAQRYFGISAKELTVSQSALLAGVLKSPSNYAPHIKYESSIRRRDLVLKQMLSTNNISKIQYDEAIDEKINLIELSEEAYPYGYYVDTVLYEAEKALNMGSEDLLKEGYTIYTNMDVNAQKSIESAASKTELPTSKDENQPEIAMVALNKEGGIVGIVGGREHVARRGLNRAMDSKRSPGSAIKPVLVYAPAYEQKGYTNANFILDDKTDFGGYTPSNSNNKFSGFVTAKQAISRSLNIPAVKTLGDVGIENAKGYAKSVGLNFEPSDNHLALALGGFSKGTTPVQLSASYLPFMTGGYYSEPYAIKKIVDKSGKTVYENKVKKEKVLSEETAFLLTDVMKDVVNNGTGKRLKSLNMNIAAKTGTSNIQGTSDNRDAWIVSYTTDYICSAWIGHDDGKALNASISGGSYPATLVERFYLDMYKGNKPADFTVPSGVVQVRLDKTLLETSRKLAIASDLAPDSQVVKEYFTLGTVPSEHSQLFQPAGEIQEFSVTLGSDGYPVISFKSEYDNINYSIFRIGEQGEVPIYQTAGKQSTITYIDKDVEEGKRYEYYIVAIVGDNRNETKKVSVKIRNLSDTKDTNETTNNTNTPDSSSGRTTKDTTQTTDKPTVGTRRREDD